jgi:hypothetical protein
MAYITYYTANFDDTSNKRINISIDRKDGDPLTVAENYELTEFSINHEADGDGLYSSIIKRSVSITLFLPVGSSVDWQTFFDQQHDEWRIIVTDEAQHIFSGYMLPDAGAIPFEDKPYEMTIKAVDGLGLLKDVPLTKIDGTNFKGKFTLIEYIAACLSKTQLELPIKIYCDIYEDSMSDRGSGIENDMFAQAKLDHRTHQKDAVEFVSCYEALEKILGEHLRLYQDYDFETDQQVWEIYRIPQYQYTPAPIIYYTLYDFDGTNPVGYEDPENYAEVGSLNLIYKVNEVTRSGKFAVKKTRHHFKYNVWPELPLNNKFERGTLDLPRSGVDYRSYSIDDWNYGTYLHDSTSTNLLPAVTATSAEAFRKSTYDIYGIEKNREIILEEPTSGGYGLLVSDGIPVNQGDKIKISFDRKLSYPKSGNGVSRIAFIFLKPSNGSAKMYIQSQNTVSNGKDFDAWVFASFGTAYFKYYDTYESFQEYISIEINPPVVPLDGDLYIGLMTTGVAGSLTYFKSFNVEYIPMVAGGYIPVKGDYWETSQTANYIDATDKEMFISDSLPKAIKGNLLRADGTTATTPTWYRYGLTEQLHYKQLANQGRYNTEYRRFFKFQGTFVSTKYAPQNDPTKLQPLSFRKTYKFVDLTQEPECVLVAPLTIDYKTGEVTAIFEEVRRGSATPIPESLADLMFRVVAAINSTPDDATGWDSAGNAPAGGTIGYPPLAAIWPSVPNTIIITMNDADNMSATAGVGGAGNSPSITEIYNQDVGTFRLVQYTFGTDIAIGNTFAFTIYGHDVVVTVQATPNGSNDGRQTGDSSIFNYLFE